MQTNGLAIDDPSPEIAAGYRLSPQQRFQWRLQKQTRLPNAQIGVLRSGSADPSALRLAFDTVRSRHEVLRTAYRHVPGMALPVQVVGGDRAPEWRQYDFRGREPAEQQADIARLAKQERHAPLDLEHGPLARLCRIDLATDQQLLLITLSSLSVDRRSLLNLACEVAAACSPDATQASGEEPLQYVQYAEWQDDLQEATDAHAASGRSYWKTLAEELAAPPDFPFSHTPVANDAFVPAALSFPLEAEILGCLESAAAQARVTPAAYLETVWALLLSRLAGGAPFALGHGCDGRAYPELQHSLGLLAKTLPLLFRWEPSTPFSLALRGADAAIRDMLGWEEYYSPDGSYASPSLPYRFDFEADFDPALPTGFSIASLHAVTETFQLGLACRRMGTDLTLEFQFDPQRFHETDIRRIADMYLTLLQSALAQPTTAVNTLEIVPAGEQKRLTVDWNRTGRDYAPFAPIHRLFEAAAHAHPDAPAVVFEVEQLTYGELNARANRLAHTLRKRGAGPDVVVGLCLERSLDLVVGMLGILKSGAAYLPLDPAD